MTDSILTAVLDLEYVSLEIAFSRNIEFAGNLYPDLKSAEVIKITPKDRSKLDCFLRDNFICLETKLESGKLFYRDWDVSSDFDWDALDAGEVNYCPYPAFSDWELHTFKLNEFVKKAGNLITDTEFGHFLDVFFIFETSNILQMLFSLNFSLKFFKLKPAPILKKKESRPTQKKSRTGFIYLIESKNTFKIGFSTNPKRRLISLQTANSEKLVLVKQVKGTLEDEQTIHSKLQIHRLNGEWYPKAIKDKALNLLTNQL